MSVNGRPRLLDRLPNARNHVGSEVIHTVILLCRKAATKVIVCPLSHPTAARAGDVCSLPLRRLQAFYEGDVVPGEKTPQRAAAGFESAVCADVQRWSGPAA